MEKNSYIAVTVEENGKYYAYVHKYHHSNNLLNLMNIKGIVYANICDTKKEAARIVGEWNSSFMENGKYMFEIPLF